MKSALRRSVLLSLALAAWATAALGAESPPPSVPSGGDRPAVSTDLQKLIEQFKSGRETVLADRKALVDQLKNATAEQRKAILERMQSQQKELVETQRALGRQIRDEMRKMRQTSPGGPRR